MCSSYIKEANIPVPSVLIFNKTGEWKIIAGNIPQPKINSLSSIIPERLYGYFSNHIHNISPFGLHTEAGNLLIFPSGRDKLIATALLFPENTTQKPTRSQDTSIATMQFDFAGTLENGELAYFSNIISVYKQGSEFTEQDETKSVIRLKHSVKHVSGLMNIPLTFIGAYRAKSDVCKTAFKEIVLLLTILYIHNIREGVCIEVTEEYGSVKFKSYIKASEKIDPYVLISILESCKSNATGISLSDDGICFTIYASEDPSVYGMKFESKTEDPNVNT